MNEVLMYWLDCCDGSDEYNSNIKCVDICFEAGKEERKALRAEMRLHEAGSKLKEELIKKAQTIKPKLLIEYEGCKSKVDELMVKLEQLQEKEEAAKVLNDIAAEIHDDDSEDFVREDEGVDDEEQMIRRRDPERKGQRDTFFETHGISAKEAKQGIFVNVIMMMSC